MAANGARRSMRTRRLNVRATERQEELIRAGAEARSVNVTDFILESACTQAEQALADRRDFVATAAQWKAFVAALDRPAQVKPALGRLFSERSERGLRK